MAFERELFSPGTGSPNLAAHEALLLMSVLTRNRIFVLTAAMSLMAASSLFASWPTARTQARMVYDRTSTNVILFGGESPNDSGTKTAYALDETWLWNGARWLRIFPSHSPGGRSAFPF